MQLSNQAVGAIMLALQKSLMEQYVLSKDEVFKLLAPMLTPSMTHMQLEYHLNESFFQQK